MQRTYFEVGHSGDLHAKGSRVESAVRGTREIASLLGASWFGTYGNLPRFCMRLEPAQIQSRLWGNSVTRFLADSGRLQDRMIRP